MMKGVDEIQLIRRSRRGLVVLMGILQCLMACSPSSNYPRDWASITPGAGDQCPDITGTFNIGDQPAYQMLGGHYDPNPRVWSVMNIAGNPQTELQITLYESETGAPYEAPIKRIRGSDYQCQAGWLRLPWPGNIPLRTDEDSIPTNHLMEKSLGLAKNSAGELVIRTSVTHWLGFPVWCGDGCKYLPIPFTHSEYFTWSRWMPAGIPQFRARRLGQVKSANEPVVSADSPAGRVKDLLLSLIPAGAELIKVEPKGEHWLALYKGSMKELVSVSQALMSSDAIAELLRTQASAQQGSRHVMEVEFRLPSDKPTRNVETVAEQARVSQSRSEHAEKERVVKLLLPCFPTGMVLTKFTTTADGFVAEVRHKEMDAFYQLVVNAMASGHFAEANISSRKYVDGMGLQVADVALKTSVD